MPRTYLNPRAQGRGKVGDARTGKENEPGNSVAARQPIMLDSSSDEENPIKFKVKASKPTFLATERDDAFDALFSTVNTRKLEAPPLRAWDATGSFSSDANSSTPSRYSRSNDSSCFGLFKSFNEKDEKLQLKQKRPNHPQRQQPKETVFSPVSQSQLSVGGSSTLDIELNFKHLALDSPTKVNHTDGLEHHERDETGISSPSAPIEDVVSRQLSIGSKMDSIVKVKMGEVGTPDLFFQTPGARKTSKTLSCLTSTPLLGSRSSQLGGLEPSFTDFTNCTAEDDVFPEISVSKLRKEGLATISPSSLLSVPPLPRHKVLSSDEVLYATPGTKVNSVRGKKTLGGPALSLMLDSKFEKLARPYWEDPLSNISAQLGKSASISKNTPGKIIKSLTSSSLVDLPSPSLDSPGLDASNPSSDAGSESCQSDGSQHIVEIIMDCPCGYHQMTEYDLIMCDGCNYYCHSNCVGLSEEDIEVIARDKPDWFCPKCLAEAARANDISSSFQNSKSDEDNYSADVPKPETNDSYHHEASPKETNSTLDLTAPLEVTSNIIVRPGKHWRRSLSANIHQSVLAASPAERSLVNPSLQPSFAVPRIPGRSNVRRSSRMTRLRSSFLPAMFEEEEDNTQPEPQPAAPPRVENVGINSSVLGRISDYGASWPRRGARPSFYIVPEAITEQKSSADVSILLKEEYSDIDKLLSHCTKKQVAKFDDIYDEQTLACSRKVGEGAFGEVYLVGSTEEQKPVLKVVPIGGTVRVNDEEQTTVTEMISEVLISMALSDLRQGSTHKTEGFVEVRKCIVFGGVYPVKLLDMWDKFDEENTSENIRPDYLPVDQLYIALEFNNGGRDLEKYEFAHASQALAAWRQVVHAVAVAEAALSFEHRDLHWGNVLIKGTDRKFVNYIVDGNCYRVETLGVETTIIDFSLSRLTSRDENCTIFKNLAEDPTLFTAQGLKAGGDYQFDIYRMMKQSNNNNWEQFNSKTNIFWLHYLLEKMITEVYYKGKKSSKPHKSGLAVLRNLKGGLLEFSSARDWIVKKGNLILN